MLPLTVGSQSTIVCIYHVVYVSVRHVPDCPRGCDGLMAWRALGRSIIGMMFIIICLFYSFIIQWSGDYC